MSDDSRIGIIAKAGMITVLSSFIVIALGLVKGKAIAVLQGTEGIGLFYQFTTLQVLLATVAGLGFSMALTKYTSEYLSTGNLERLARSWRSALLVTSFVSIGLMVFLVLSSRWISLLLVGNSSVANYVVIVSISVPIAALAGLYNGLINGAKAIKTLAKVSILGAIFSVVATIPLVYFLGTEGVIAQIATSASIMLVIAYFAGKRITSKWTLPQVTGLIDRRETRLLVLFGFYQLLTGLFHQTTMLFAQTMVVHEGNLSSNGIFQSAWSIAWPMISVGVASVAIYLLPVMSASQGEADLHDQVNNSFRFLMVLATPVACMLILFSDPILVSVYSEQFLSAGPLLRFMALGAVLRMLVTPLAMRFVAKARLGVPIVADALWYSVFGGSIILLLPLIGILACGIAFFLSQVVYSVFLTIGSVREHGRSPFTLENVRLGSYSIALPVIVFVLVATIPYQYSIAAGVVIIVLWPFAVLNAREKAWISSGLFRAIVNLLRVLLKRGER